MIFRDLSFKDPVDNLLFDEVLLARAEKRLIPETVRVWASPVHFVVLGRLGDPRVECCLEALRVDRVKVFRRSSGGGTVLQGPGCLNFTLVLDKDRDPALRDIRGSYEWISFRIISLLKTLGVRACSFPVSDLGLAESNKKFSGNAQKRGREFLLHHGTLLWNFDLSLISRYLQQPADQPDWRADRLHHEFVANLPGLTPALIKDGFRREFAFQREQPEMTPEEAQDLGQFKIHRQVFVDIDKTLL